MNVDWWKSRPHLVALAERRPEYVAVFEGATPDPARPMNLPCTQCTANPVRVGFWSPVLSAAGGVETWHETIVSELAKIPKRVKVQGIAVADFAGAHPATVQRLQAHCPVSVGPWSLAVLAARCDVVVGWADTSPHIYAPGQRIRYIAVSHGDARNKGWTTARMHACEKSTTRYVAVAPEALEPIPSHRRAESVVIPNGVLESRLRGSQDFGRALREEWGVPGGVRLVGILQRLSDEKDPDALIRLVSHLPERWHGVAIGDGAEMGRLKAWAESACPGRIHFAGVRHDIGDCLRSIDWLLAPSPTEGFGLSIVEAWTVGVPVICPEVGIVVEHPDLARIMSPGASGEELARLITADCIAWHGTHKRVRRARETALAWYGSKRFAAKWVRVIEEVAGRVKPRVPLGRPCLRPASMP